MKCAVSDFDRTLYVDSTISQRNLEAVKAWQEAGNWFVIATGRNGVSLRELLEEYRVKPDALILNNGALILDRDWRELFCRFIGKDEAVKVLMYLYEQNDDGCGISLRHRKVNVLSGAGTTTQKPCGGNLTMEEIDSLEEILQIHHRRLDEAYTANLCRDLNMRFPAISAYANICNTDIVARGVDKSAAIAWLEKYQGGFDEILVIGDSANDVGMIREYGGATLKSAAASVQAVAGRVVEDVAEYLSGV